MRAPLLAISSLIALLLAARGAGAADLTPSPPPAPASAWQGFYIGPHLGYGSSRKTYFDNFPVFDGEVDADIRAGGFIGGVQLGYNVQVHQWLVGLEGDFSWSAMKKTDFACFSFGDQICTARPQMFAELTGRLGYIAGPWLVYAKGGAAFVQDRFENLATCAGTQPVARNGINAACGTLMIADHSRPGWVIGAGVERFIADRWSLKLEYNYLDFGSASVSFKDGNNGFFTEEIRQRAHLLKLGLNYHFAAPTLPATPASQPLKARASADGDDNGSNRIVAFAGVDAARDSYSTFVGGLMAPFGSLDTSGARLFLLGEGGYYRYPNDPGKITGYTSGASVLGGWGFEGDTYSINLLGGGNVINHTLTSVDLSNDLQGTLFGAMARADMRLNPTPKWLISSEGSYSTAFRSYDATAKLGYEVIPNSGMYFGPEVGTNGDKRSWQWRFGAHLSEISIGSLQFDISAGYARDSDNGPGFYGHLEMSRTF